MKKERSRGDALTYAWKMMMGVFAVYTIISVTLYWLGYVK